MTEAVLTAVGEAVPTIEKGREDAMSEKANKAKALFRQGYSCAQAVLLAFEEETGLDKTTAALISSSFGGGMGRLREVCGAFSSAIMILGLKNGTALPQDEIGKARQYEEIQQLAERFRKENGSLICRDLLDRVPTTSGSAPQTRDEAYYQQRPCEAIVGRTAKMINDYLEELK